MAINDYQPTAADTARRMIATGHAERIADKLATIARLTAELKDTNTWPATGSLASIESNLDDLLDGFNLTGLRS